MSESKRSPLRATVPLHVTLQPPGRIQPRHFVESQDLCWMDDGKGETNGEAKGSWHHRAPPPSQGQPCSEARTKHKSSGTSRTSSVWSEVRMVTLTIWPLESSTSSTTSSVGICCVSCREKGLAAWPHLPPYLDLRAHHVSPRPGSSFPPAGPCAESC